MLHAALPTTALRNFQSGVHGRLVCQGDGDYDHARRVWNGRIDKYPAALVCCADVVDVVTAVAFARSQNLLVAIRSGGHSLSGSSLCDGGLVIDLSSMKGIRVDPQKRTAWAQAGLRLSEFVRATQVYGLATTTGTVGGTGLAGLTLGGGLGWFMGKYGLTVDNLLSVELVTADGQVLTASATEHPDLFWGVRGGGGNFGIVTALEYQLHPDGLPAIAINLCYCGPLQEVERLLEPVRKFGSPLVDLIRPKSYLSVIARADAGTPAGRHYYERALTLTCLSDEALDTIADAGAACTSPYSIVLFQHLHGAASRVSPTTTAFALREESYIMSIVAAWDSGQASAGQRHIEWVRAYWRAMEPDARPGVYVNFLGDEGEGRVRATYGVNYKRLVALKNRYDPNNFFALNQNIKPTLKEGDHTQNRVGPVLLEGLAAVGM
jgi:FAD/FMN-containing dehydrogenase